MHIRHQFPTKYTIRQDDKDWILQEVEEERDLGIITTADFKVSRQCTEAASKANKVLGMVSRQGRILNHLQRICKTTLRICHKNLVTILERRCQPFGEGPEESNQISKMITWPKIHLRGRHMSRHSRPILQRIGMQSLVRYGADVTLLSTVAT